MTNGTAWRGRRAEWLTRNEGRATGALLLTGFLLRLAYAFRRGIANGAEGEAFNAAIGFARTGIISGPYRLDDVPTAHFLPIPIAIAGAIYRLFGERSVAAETVLAMLAIALVMTGFLLFHRAFTLLGLPLAARLGALAFLCLAPVNMRLETVDFRIWEGAYAVAAMGALLCALLASGRGTSLSWRQIVLIAFLAALLFFINPLLGLGGYLCVALRLVRLDIGRMAAAGIATAAMLALFVAPWAIRNDRLIGAPILLRSNFGLELTVAFNPLAATEGRKAFRAIMEQVHPFESDAAYAALRRAGGERPYFAALGATTTAWMKAHPAQTAVLGLRHLRQFLFPPRWLWTIYGDSGADTAWSKQAVAWIISLLALVGVGVALGKSLRSRRVDSLNPVFLIATPAGLAIMTQPVLRYRYIVFALSVYLAATALAALAGRPIRSRR